MPGGVRIAYPPPLRSFLLSHARWLLFSMCIMPAPAEALATDPPAWVAEWPVDGWSISVAPDGSVVVADPHKDTIDTYSSSGTVLSSFGSEGAANGQFMNALGICVADNGDIYVSDFDQHRVQRFSPSGEYELQWGSPGAGAGQFNNPKAIIETLSNTILVCDYGNHRLQEFSADGTFIRSLGEGVLSNPTGVGMLPSGEIVISDHEDKVKILNPSGALVRSWGASGNKEGWFENPIAVTVTLNGTILVADRLNHRIQEFTATGTFQTTWGTFGPSSGDFAFPTDLAVNALGQILVVDAGNSRVQVFDYGIAVEPSTWSGIKSLYQRVNE
jgi:tripartite motif-containing protein 71